MNGWSPEDAIAMERRHILEGEKRVARQEALVKELTEKGHDRIVPQSNELLGVLRALLELSRERLQDLEHRYCKVSAAGRHGPLPISLFRHELPRRNTEMNERVTTVVDGFMRLDPQEKTVAYLEIEAVWKDQQQEEPEERPDLSQPACEAK
jgi:hypothetical protein